MTEKCEYCNQSFVSKSSLNLHKKTAKYCLKLQNKLPESSFTCEKCLCAFNIKSNYETHTSHCKSGKGIELKYNKLIEENTNLLNELSDLKLNLKEKIIRLEYSEKEIKKLEENNKQLESKIKQLEKDNLFNSRELVCAQVDHIDTVKKQMEQINRMKNEESKAVTTAVESLAKVTAIASKPSVVQMHNQTVNNTLNLGFPLDITPEFLNSKKIYLTEDHVRSKQKGMADWFIEYVVKNQEGQLGLICTDKNRKHFKYLKEDGTIVSDPECRNIVQILNLNVISRIGEHLQAICGYDIELLEKYKYGRLFGKEFIKCLIAKLYANIDQDISNRCSKDITKKRIMNDTGMTESEYELITKRDNK